MEVRGQQLLISPPGDTSRKLRCVVNSCTAKCHDSQLGLTTLPTDVKLITKPEDLAYIDLCNRVGVQFKAVLAEGAANYGQETRLTTTTKAFDALEKSREYPSGDIITFQLSTKEWCEISRVELAIREALEIELMRIKGENAELLTEMKALRQLEATRSQDLEKSWEILLITSHILEEQASRASEDSQKIAHAAAYLKLGSNPRT
ncbi:hypothetical protein V499_04121 [Pseudogymnoascus sp. VKM F-103]|nr:hypothetical protein V499_04121 [Pseudogymnoascus sp. VKM F-103]